MSAMETQDGALAQLALEKLTRVLGEARAQRVFEETIATLPAQKLHDADDLYGFGERLVERGGIEAAVGRLISVAAVVRGASGKS